MWEIRLFGFEWFYLFYHFFLYSFFGWIYESCLVSFQRRKLVNRGFLNGPVIPIYGAGATVIMMALDPIREHYVAVFFVGMLVASVLEFVTSWLMEKLFHTRWWDYSDWKCNLQGRICLGASLFWGVLSVTMELVLKPGMDLLIADIPRRAGEVVGYGIAAVFLADFIVTVISTVQFDKKLAELQRIRAELLDYLAKHKLTDITGGLVGEWRSRLASLLDTGEWEETVKNIFSGSETGEKWIEAWKGIFSRYQHKLEKANLIQRRLLGAFPNMKSIGKEEALEDWKKKLHRKKEG